MIAESIISAASDLGPLKVPIVVRLQGTNSAEGLKLVCLHLRDESVNRTLILTIMQLEEANLGIEVEADFGSAAKKAVELANGMN